MLSSRRGDWLPKAANVVVLHVKMLIEKLSAGEGLDWQHIRNEFYTAMPESFGEVSGFVWSTRLPYMQGGQCGDSC